MKKFIALVVLLTAGAALFRHSVFFSIWRLKTAIDAGDLAAVEQRADLDAFAGLPVELAMAAAQASAESAAPGGAVGGLVGALGNALGSLINVGAKPLALAELRSRIEKHELNQLLGPFQLRTVWFGGTQTLEGATVVQVNGTCADKKNPKERIDTSLGVVFTQVPGPLLGFPADYRATGVEAASLKALAKQCDVSIKLPSQ